MHQLSPPKPFKSHSDLVALLASRGMQIGDDERAERKLAQGNRFAPPPSFPRRRESRLTFCIHEDQNTLDSRPRGNDDIWAMGLNGYSIRGAC